jgi:PhnB protein
MTEINPYLNFNGSCREAMNFYKECLGGELTLMAVKDTPAGAACQAGTENQIMHSSLVNDGFTIMATDMTGPEGLQQGNNFSLTVNCSSEEELNRVFDTLLAGGTVIEPLKLQFWGGIFGFGADKFGIRWMFNYTKNEQI